MVVFDTASSKMVARLAVVGDADDMFYDATRKRIYISSGIHGDEPAGPLAVHLGRHGRIAFGDEIEIRQGAEIGRASVLHARAEGSRERIERVEVGGSAVIVGGGAFVVVA